MKTVLKICKDVYATQTSKRYLKDIIFFYTSFRYYIFLHIFLICLLEVAT